ncbi:MAG TPA: inositol monophosphatase [Acidimicrobiales bacterium]|nr:inositol monophosphatase [Acidimicrobiales bacterium]
MTQHKTPDDSALLAVLHEVCDAVSTALSGIDDWGLAGTRPGQHYSDLVADAAALEVLTASGLTVLSEESGITPAEGSLLAVVDPLDGSTNAWHRVPWYATAICIVDDEGPVVAVVANQATNIRFEARRGRGATVDGVAIAPSGKEELSESLIGLTAWPRAHFGWRQFRALGAAALDMCAVAAGVLDGYIDCTPVGIHGVWDYLAASLICTEAGAVVGEVGRRELLVRDPAERRGPVAAATPALLDELLASHARYLAPPATR